MCLVGFAFQVNQDYPLILLGNRDEYHARPSAPLDWWADQPHILGGRDLLAGGTWLAASKAAHLAVVTNRPDQPAPEHGALSRGDLVTGALTPANFSLTELERNHHRYGGFSLLVANRSRLSLFSGGNGADFARRSLAPGLYGISNTPIDEPWPKVQWLLGQMKAHAAGTHPAPAELLDLLERREPVPGSTDNGVPATPFIAGEEYGTRCATLVTVRTDGAITFVERRFGPGGARQGETTLHFRAPASSAEY